MREGVNNAEDRYSEHGLGHLLNPADPESEDRDWIAQAWLSIVRRSLGLPRSRCALRNGSPWGGEVSSPAVMKPLKPQRWEGYDKQIKPFNLILSCHVRKLGHPIGADPERFHLIAPYETDPRKWETMRWIDQYSKDGKRYRISTRRCMAHGPWRASKAMATCCASTSTIPKRSAADASGAPCRKQTIGLLGRRHIAIDGFVFIGKESNKLEQVEEGGVSSESNVYTKFYDAQRDEWETKWLPMLRSKPGPTTVGTRCIARDNLCRKGWARAVQWHESETDSCAQARDERFVATMRPPNRARS